MNDNEIYGIVKDVTDRIEATVDDYPLPKEYKDLFVKICDGVRCQYTPIAPNGKIDDEKINDFFEKTWTIYPRKVNKVQAKKTYANKLRGLSVDEGRLVANTIYRGLENQSVLWRRENNGQGRSLDKLPHFSTWLNANIDDAPKGKR